MTDVAGAAVRLTAEQASAVARRDSSLLLAAAAGSGKTSVLVERFVAAVLDDGIAPGRILAITFTDRAAGELRERVRNRFLEEGRRDHARDTEAAFVGTFHGFCRRLLRAHALEAGLDPAFAILDEPRAARLRSLAFRSALGAWLRGEDAAAAVDLAAAYGADRLAGMITGVHEELRSRGQRAPALPPIDGGAYSGAAPQRAAAELLDAVRLASVELGEALSRGGAPGRRLLDAMDVLERARGLLEPLAALGPAGEPPLPAALARLSLPAANGVLAGPGCEGYRAALEVLRRAWADHHGALACRRLDGLLGRYGEVYAAAKRERHVLDFDDLELMARDLLEGDEAVRRAWSERFALMMVDEFQDTNPRQLAILDALERDNLFTVGDEFQSIYGFRHADVNLFRQRRRALAGGGAALDLARNFRSRPEILDVVNAVFAPRFGHAFTPLVAGRDDEPSAEPLVELLLTDNQGWDGDDSPLARGDPLPPGQPWRHAEARLLAQRIGDLVAAGQAAPGDVAVLVRATGDIPVYERALEDRGLPTLAAGAGGYWSRQQVGDMLAYLGALANPLDERALCSLLASPLVGISPDALAVIVGAGGESHAGAWAELTRAFAVGDAEAPPDGGAPAPDVEPADGEPADAWPDRLPAADRARLGRFCPMFAAERASAPRRTLAELLERALSLTGYETHVLGLRWGERRLANVRKLLRLAREFESTEGRDLRGFLDHAARQAAAHVREADAPVEDAELDAIRLMTIHAAKGLEFPVVAVADLGRSGRSDSADLVVDGGRVGLRLVALDASKPVGALDFERLRSERLEAEAREEERILYVATTRARERLLLSGATNVDRWPAPRLNGAQILWLAPALADGLPDRLQAPAGTFDVAPPAGPQARVRCLVSRAASVGEVLREESLRAVSRDPAPGADTVAEDVGPDPATAPGPGPADLSPPASAQTLSYSALADHERCGYRFYLERVLRLPADDAAEAAEAAGRGVAGGGLDARTRGSLVHRLLESMDFARPVAPAPEAVALVAAELGAQPDAAECARISALVTSVAGTALAERLAVAARVHREVPFAFALEPDDPLVTGVIDALALDLGGNWLVVDYKSDQVSPEEDLEEMTEHEYGIQRRVYALAALRAGAAEVEVAHWYLGRADEPAVAGWKAADAGALAGELHTRVRAISEGDFPVSPNPHRDLCLTCPGRRGLCTWDEERTLRPRPPSPPSEPLDPDAAAN
jgi:ATP-dependent exoDNAse (exonuclease V) beta subunit